MRGRGASPTPPPRAGGSGDVERSAVPPERGRSMANHALSFGGAPRRLVLSGALALSAFGPVHAQEARTTGRVLKSPGGTELRVLVDAQSLGGSEVEVAELTFQPNSDSGDHPHGVTET